MCFWDIITVLYINEVFPVQIYQRFPVYSYNKRCFELFLLSILGALISMFNVLPKVPSNKDNIIRTAKKTHQNDLILSGHYLSHIPWSIFQDPLPRNLIFLDLSNNNLSFLPNEIGSLTNLEKFYVSGNFLTELPAAIKRLVKLKGIDLSRNSIKCLPEEVNALKHLEWINLSGNKLRIIPVYLLCLPKLVKVHCLRNPELENVPKSIAREGLHAMREYLQVNVEKYESIDRAEKKKDRLKTSAVLDEIFDKWNFTEDHKCQKKTKDASTTSDMGTDDLDFSTFNNPNDGASSRGNCNTCAATQTEPEDFDSAVVPQKTVNFPYLRLNSDFTSLGHEWWRRRRKYGDADSSQGKSIKDYNDLMGELVRCFHEQLDLVNDYKISMLLNRERRNIVSVNCAESLPIYSSTPVKDRGVIKCKSCGLKKTGLSTSDYGTMSVDNTIDLYDEYDEDYNESCGGNSRGSLCEELSWSDDVSEAICDGDSDTEEEILW